MKQLSLILLLAIGSLSAMETSPPLEPYDKFNLTVQINEQSPHSGKRKTRSGNFHLPLNEDPKNNPSLKQFLENPNRQITLRLIARTSQKDSAPPGSTFAFYDIEKNEN
jgi:hypothetical protein